MSESSVKQNFVIMQQYVGRAGLEMEADVQTAQTLIPIWPLRAKIVMLEPAALLFKQPLKHEYQ